MNHLYLNELCDNTIINKAQSLVRFCYTSQSIFDTFYLLLKIRSLNKECLNRTKKRLIYIITACNFQAKLWINNQKYINVVGEYVFKYQWQKKIEMLNLILSVAYTQPPKDIIAYENTIYIESKTRDFTHYTPIDSNEINEYVRLIGKIEYLFRIRYQREHLRNIQIVKNKLRGLYTQTRSIMTHST